MTFYLTLFIFIASVIGGLALMIAAPRLSKSQFFLLVSMHSLFLFAFLASLILRKNTTTPNYFFMAYVCSGIVLSGVSWRNNYFTLFKFYFSLFIFCIPLFLLSPSMLINFLVRMDFSTSAGKTFKLTEKYFLEQQNSGPENANGIYYKIITKNGMFHKTISRDINFIETLDSARLLKATNENLQIRGYYHQKTYVSLVIDSADVEIVLKKKSPGSVEYRL